MPRLPVLSGQEVVRVFEALGWEVARQRSTHIVMVKERERASLSVPDHDEVSKGVLRKLIRLAELTVEDFVEALADL